MNNGEWCTETTRHYLYASKDYHVEQTTAADVVTAESVDLQKLVKMMGLLSYQDGAVPKGFLCEAFLRRTLHFRLP